MRYSILKMKWNIIRTLYAIVVMFFIAFFLTSCDEEVSDDLTLRGNIDNLIPNGVIKVSVASLYHDGNTYIRLSPKVYADFDFWGLYIRSMDFLIDGESVGTKTTEPYTLNYVSESISSGSHEAISRITIGGNECDDAIICDTTNFYANSTTYTGQGDFYIDYNLVTTGDNLQITPYLLEETSSEGCEITTVAYYWDGELLNKATSSPFSLNYQVTEEVGTSHDISIIINYKDNKNSNLTYSYGHSGFMIYGPEEVAMYFITKSSRMYCDNGDTLSGMGKVFVGKESDATCNMCVYWDDEIVDTTTNFPYEFNYAVHDAETNTIHDLTMKGEVTYGDGTTKTYSQTQHIIVLE